MTHPEASDAHASETELELVEDAKAPRTHAQLARRMLELATASEDLQESEAKLTEQLDEVRRRRDAVDDELLEVRRELAPGKRERKKSRTPTQAASSKDGSPRKGVAELLKGSLTLAPREWRTTRQCFEMVEAGGYLYDNVSKGLAKLVQDGSLEKRKSKPGEFKGIRLLNLFRRVAK